ncbi:mechanosensitive ion channel [Fulvivirga sp. M361]|uniref:mechanosensitive ion channel family protein n=1 Tax=Fulvivirga sp. M361 TaxID=2594266 RepID=UPI00117AC0A8|nr:mechanosensitive ion channel domain-containing protein [Fulvivirga sp. M361]TRX61768.1 mechanosensitive ion channel [Fulvivirga sp. M361]
MEHLEQMKNLLMDYAVDYGLAILKAIIVLVIGLWIIRAIRNGFEKLLSKRNVDASLKPFLGSLVYNILLVLLILSVLSTIGIQMTSFIAIVGAAGLAIGLALQGTLQNFAGGVVILVLRPFKVGDYIDGGGHSGTVKEIQIFNTVLITPDNKRITIPNGTLSNDSIVNYSSEPIRRVDMVFGIGYDDDIKTAKDLLESIVTSDERILKDPAHTIAVSELGDSSVNFAVRPWVKKEDYWSVFFDLQEKVKLEFDKAGISIPYPQRDIHVYNEK